ncbi:MAG: hypothetical protein AAF629_34730 [Chloroflexota bacterium]
MQVNLTSETDILSYEDARHYTQVSQRNMLWSALFLGGGLSLLLGGIWLFGIRAATAEVGLGWHPILQIVLIGSGIILSLGAAFHLLKANIHQATLQQLAFADRQPTTEVQFQDSLVFEQAVSVLDNINQLTTSLEVMLLGLLIAVTGGSLVLGIMAGGLLWIPFGMSAPLLTFCIIQRGQSQEVRQTRRRLALHQLIVTQKQALQISDLSEQQKEQALYQLDMLLDQ